MCPPIPLERPGPQFKKFKKFKKKVQEVQEVQEIRGGLVKTFLEVKTPPGLEFKKTLEFENS